MNANRIKFVIFGIMAIGFGYIFILFIAHIIRVRELNKKAINGQITSISETRKGYARITVRNENEIFELPSILFIYEIRENKVSVGDSLYKKETD